MLSTDDIWYLYSKILYNYILFKGVSEDDIRIAIQAMAEVYRPNPNGFSNHESLVADYNRIAHRCAYIHKCVPLHTVVVWEMLKRALSESETVFWIFLQSHTKPLRICCLGGGPGNDVIGVIAALQSKFGLFHCDAKVIDIMSGWKDTFGTTVDELRSGKYGILDEGFAPRYFKWSYVAANLLGKWDMETKDAIKSTNLITMVKFVSATACQDTYRMIQNIFSTLQPGALVLFIDNASGGFRELISDAGKECNLVSVFGPLNYVEYTNEAFKVKRFGYTSCYSTTITFQILKKMPPSQKDKMPGSTPIHMFQNQNLSYTSSSNHSILKYESEQQEIWPSFPSVIGTFEPVTKELQGKQTNLWNTRSQGITSAWTDSEFIQAPAHLRESTGT